MALTGLKLKFSEERTSSTGFKRGPASLPFRAARVHLFLFFICWPFSFSEPAVKRTLLPLHLATLFCSYLPLTLISLFYFYKFLLLLCIHMGSPGLSSVFSQLISNINSPLLSSTLPRVPGFMCRHFQGATILPTILNFYFPFSYL